MEKAIIELMKRALKKRRLGIKINTRWADREFVIYRKNRRYKPMFTGILHKNDMLLTLKPDYSNSYFPERLEENESYVIDFTNPDTDTQVTAMLLKFGIIRE